MSLLDLGPKPEEVKITDFDQALCEFAPKAEKRVRFADLNNDRPRRALTAIEVRDKFGVDVTSGLGEDKARRISGRRSSPRLV